MSDQGSLVITSAPSPGVALVTLNRAEKKNALSIALRDELSDTLDALAGGFDLAVMCDLRVAADTARFAHPEITFGDVVYGPLHDLVRGTTTVWSSDGRLLATGAQQMMCRPGSLAPGG